MPVSADQLDAALAEVRGMLATALPGQTPLRPSQWAIDFVDSRLTLPRCRHLHARPVQPHMLTVWDAEWLCRSCTVQRDEHRQRAAARGAYIGLGVVEEGTCDGCRVYRGTENLTPTVMRIDLWTVVCALCPGCERRAAGDP